MYDIINHGIQNEFNIFNKYNFYNIYNKLFLSIEIKYQNIKNNIIIIFDSISNINILFMERWNINNLRIYIICILVTISHNISKIKRN